MGFIVSIIGAILIVVNLPESIGNRLVSIMNFVDSIFPGYGGIVPICLFGGLVGCLLAIYEAIFSSSDKQEQNYRRQGHNFVTMVIEYFECPHCHNIYKGKPPKCPRCNRQIRKDERILHHTREIQVPDD